MPYTAMKPCKHLYNSCPYELYAAPRGADTAMRRCIVVMCKKRASVAPHAAGQRILTQTPQKLYDYAYPLNQWSASEHRNLLLNGFYPSPTLALVSALLPHLPLFLARQKRGLEKRFQRTVSTKSDLSATHFFLKQHFPVYAAPCTHCEDRQIFEHRVTQVPRIVYAPKTNPK